MQVLRPDDSNFGLKISNRMAFPVWSLQPGTEFTARWGTDYGRARARVEIEHRGKLLARYWTDPRGGFNVKRLYDLRLQNASRNSRAWGSRSQSPSPR